MKYLIKKCFYIIVVANLLCSCKTKNNVIKSNDLQNNIEELQDTIGNRSINHNINGVTNLSSFYPDTSLGPFFALLDHPNSKVKIKKETYNFYYESYFLKCISSYLRIGVCLGGANESCYFELLSEQFPDYQDADSVIYNYLEIDTLMTNNNIYLGMSEEEFHTKIDSLEFNIIYHLDFKEYNYYRDNYDNDPFLKFYNYPFYKAIYSFSKGKLIRIEFGFPTP